MKKEKTARKEMSVEIVITAQRVGESRKTREVKSVKGEESVEAPPKEERLADGALATR